MGKWTKGKPSWQIECGEASMYPTDMEWHRILFYAYCVFVLASPSGNNAYFILVNNIAFFFSFPLFHLFREFIASGPPASKTVIHGLVTSFTYCLQLHTACIYGLSIIGWFPDSTEEFINSHPQGFCNIVCFISIKPALIFVIPLLLWTFDNNQNWNFPQHEPWSYVESPQHSCSHNMGWNHSVTSDGNRHHL